MRKNCKKQMPLTITSIDHPHAEELEGISKILDANSIINEWVLEDVTRNPNPPPKWRQGEAVASEEAFGHLHTASPAQEAP
ncbi:MAG: hypothetical protein V1758_12260 [Pseudomonadota bacterium]